MNGQFAQISSDLREWVRVIWQIGVSREKSGVCKTPFDQQPRCTSAARALLKTTRCCTFSPPSCIHEPQTGRMSKQAMWHQANGRLQ